MNGYKVLSKRYRQSCRANRYMWDMKWSVTYPIKEEVRANVEGSKLFFFKERDDAIRFSNIVDEIVVPCVAKSVVKIKYIGGYILNLEDFWKKRSKSKHIMRCPKGTYLAESITCLE